MLPLPTAASLSGEWQVSSSAGHCALTLSEQPGPNTHNRDYVLTLPHATSHCEPLKKATGWRPTPDGITLTDADGARVVFFSRHGEGHYVAVRDDLELRRLPADQDAS